jgi:hypothetical protein
MTTSFKIQLKGFRKNNDWVRMQTIVPSVYYDIVIPDPSAEMQPISSFSNLSITYGPRNQEPATLAKTIRDMLASKDLAVADIGELVARMAISAPSMLEIEKLWKEKKLALTSTLTSKFTEEIAKERQAREEGNAKLEKICEHSNELVLMVCQS